MAADYVKALTWPVLFWIVADLYFFVVSYIGGVLEQIVLPAVAPLLVLAGAWGGNAIVKHGGKWMDVIGAGVVLGLVCGGGGLILFGVARGLGVGAVFPGSTMDFSLSFLGALLGGWWTLSQTARPAMGMGGGSSPP